MPAHIRGQARNCLAFFVDEIERGKIMKTYYGLLKTGDLRRYEKPPKREHLTMDSKYANDGVSVHILSYGEISREYVAHCGYDRGPRLDRLIKKMLT